MYLAYKNPYCLSNVQLFIYELGGTLLDYAIASSEKNLVDIVYTTFGLGSFGVFVILLKIRNKNEHYFWL